MRVLILQNTNPDFGRGFRASGRKFQTETSSTATLFGTTHRYIVAIRQRIRQYMALCLITQMLMQIGLQVPIKTIRQ